MSDKLIGKTLAGRFVLEELLGTGATGSVFRAHQASVDRTIAVKTLHPFLHEREDFRARFEIEAKAIARLNHPNCITLYDFGYDEEFDVFYMAVEFIKGKQLADMIDQGLSADDVFAIVFQIAEALDHAHREGILHRDLKPENIMIEVHPDSGRFVVKVLDFGLARLYEAGPQPGEEAPSGRYKQITEVGQVYGTPAYMSPEQCRGNEDLTPATDLYALGTMMFEMLECELPFFSKSTAELIMMQMTDDPPLMTRIDIGPEVKDLVHRMMAKDPSVRPQSAKDVMGVLLPYVRLDASQEFRMPSGISGEFARPTPDQLRSVTRSGPLLPPPAAVSVEQEVELSNDELRSASTGSTALIAFILIVLVGSVAGGVVLLGGSSDETAAPAVADVPAVQAAAATAEAPVEPAEEVPDARVAEDDSAVAEANPDKTVAVRKKKAKPDSKPDEAQPKPAPSESSTEPPRAKTLKLTY